MKLTQLCRSLKLRRYNVPVELARVKRILLGSSSKVMSVLPLSVPLLLDMVSVALSLDTTVLPPGRESSINWKIHLCFSILRQYIEHFPVGSSSVWWKCVERDNVLSAYKARRKLSFILSSLKMIYSYRTSLSIAIYSFDNSYLHFYILLHPYVYELWANNFELGMKITIIHTIWYAFYQRYSSSHGIIGTYSALLIFLRSRLFMECRYTSCCRKQLSNPVSMSLYKAYLGHTARH